MKPPSEAEIRARLAGNVVAARKRKRWTQQMLADRSQLPRSYIADVEGGRRNPSLRNLLRFANALGVALHELFLDG